MGSCLVVLGRVAHRLLCPQVMKTYHMYHAESISAESKLKEAEKQEEKQFNKSGDISVNLLRHEDRPQRRSSVKKIEKMKEKVGERGGRGSQAGAGAPCGRGVRLWPSPFLRSRSCIPGKGLGRTSTRAEGWAEEAVMSPFTASWPWRSAKTSR